MEAIGIIAEYNPFHNGHLYHLNMIKKKYPNHTIILVMSGNFTQRGEPSIIDKWKRTEIAKKAGIDLIIELPFPFATQSADFFAYGAITILEKLKVERFIFGSESDDLDTLELIANTQINNKELDSLVHVYSKMGYNYPTALSNAIKDITGKTISTPNDLLGVSYIKVIKENNYKIIPETIKRTNEYHEKELNEISSATAIRNALKEGKNISNSVPDYTNSNLDELHFIEDYFPYIKYKIITEENLDKYQTVSEGIENLLKDKILHASTYQELVESLTSKRYTTNKIQRMLLHILVNFTKEKASKMKDITYIRLLGMNDNGKKYLNSIKKDIDIPIISKIKRDKDEMLDFEIETTKIYEIIKKDKYYENIYKEYENHLK